MKVICELGGARVRPAPQLLPEVSIAELLHNSPPIRLERVECDENGGISLLQLVVINSLCSLVRPMHLFEFGTFRGRTTLNLAANSPEGATVFTLDLPREDLEGARFKVLDGENTFVSKKDSSRYFSGTPYSGKVVQLFGDSATFDYSPYLGTMDFIFIDASHGYDAVLNDSRRAMEMLRGGHGIILWDDYDEWYEGLTRAVSLLYTTEPAFRGMQKIRNTSMAYLRC